MTKKAEQYIRENLSYYSKIPTNTKRGKDALAKKAWVITSDYIRMRDFIKYGFCASCKKTIVNWRESDPAHYHTFAGNGALLAFNDLNIHMSCKYCNGFRGAAAGHEMADEMARRYGDGILNELLVIKNQTTKADDWFYIDKIMEMYGKFQELKLNHPEYDYPNYI